MATDSGSNDVACIETPLWLESNAAALARAIQPRGPGGADDADEDEARGGGTGGSTATSFRRISLSRTMISRPRSSCPEPSSSFEPLQQLQPSCNAGQYCGAPRGERLGSGLPGKRTPSWIWSCR